MSEQTNISFEAALMIALRADAQKELDTLPTPEQLEELYPFQHRTVFFLNGMNEWQWHYGGKNTVRC